MRAITPTSPSTEELRAVLWFGDCSCLAPGPCSAIAALACNCCCLSQAVRNKRSRLLRWLACLSIAGLSIALRKEPDAADHPGAPTSEDEPRSVFQGGKSRAVGSR